MHSNALNFSVAMAAQLLPLLHLVLAGIATVVVLRKRNELSRALAVTALLIAWLVPLLGPASVWWGLRNHSAPQT